MPARILKYSRTEPARTTLFAVSLLTGLAQFATFFITVPWWAALPNAAIVLPIVIWAGVAAYKNNSKHMARSSFWVALLWGWTGLLRLIIVEGVGELLWVPFLILSVVMGIVYLYLSYQRRIGELA